MPTTSTMSKFTTCPTYMRPLPRLSWGTTCTIISYIQPLQHTNDTPSPQTISTTTCTTSCVTYALHYQLLSTMSGIMYTSAVIQVLGLRQLNTTIICYFKWCIWRASVCTTWILTVGLCNVYATAMAVIGVEWLLVQNGLGCTWLD